jgi:DNA-binding FrmR family transcriptional regulator
VAPLFVFTFTKPWSFINMVSSQPPKPNLVRDRFLRQLNHWLDPALLYHCFTGENDGEKLARINNLQSQPWLLEPLLNKVEREWPQRLQQIADARKAQKLLDKKVVETFLHHHVKDHRPH